MAVWDNVLEQIPEMYWREQFESHIQGRDFRGNAKRFADWKKRSKLQQTAVRARKARWKAKTGRAVEGAALIERRKCSQSCWVIDESFLAMGGQAATEEPATMTDGVDVRGWKRPGRNQRRPASRWSIISKKNIKIKLIKMSFSCFKKYQIFEREP